MVEGRLQPQRFFFLSSFSSSIASVNSLKTIVQPFRLAECKWRFRISFKQLLLCFFFFQLTLFLKTNSKWFLGMCVLYLIFASISCFFVSFELMRPTCMLINIFQVNIVWRSPHLIECSRPIFSFLQFEALSNRCLGSMAYWIESD